MPLLPDRTEHVVTLEDRLLTDELERTKAKLTGARAEAARQRKITAKVTAELERQLGVMEAANAIPPEFAKPAKWTSEKRKPGGLRCTPWLTLSDLHLDEVVVARQVGGRNSYNRRIAEKRLGNVVDNTIGVMRDQLSGLNVDGLVCALGGDIITGDIHDELAATNESPVPATIIHWVPILADHLRRLADAFGKVHVPCVVGNHDRTGKKITYKNRAEQSFAHIIYHWLAYELRSNKDISFQISAAPDLAVKVYGTRFLLEHGDAWRGGGGVGGIYPPMLRYVARKHNIADFDHMVVGHWHQLLYHSDIFVNGSLKGWDEYAQGHGFGWERPQQMLFVVTPENGVTIQTAAFAD